MRKSKTKSSPNPGRVFDEFLGGVPMSHTTHSDTEDNVSISTNGTFDGPIADHWSKDELYQSDKECRERKLSLQEKITPHARVVLHQKLGEPHRYCVEWGLGKIDHEQYFFTSDAANKFYNKLCKSIGIKTRHDSNFDSDAVMVYSKENYTICKIKRGYCVLWADNGNVCSTKFSNKEAAIACGEYQVSSIRTKNNSTKE